MTINIFPEPPSPKCWVYELARQCSLGGSKRRVIRIKAEVD
jgi:hypothetical protein